MKVKLEHDFAAMSLYRFNCDSELWWTTPWAAYKPLTAEEVKRAMRGSVPGFDQCLNDPPRGSKIRIYVAHGGCRKPSVPAGISPALVICSTM